MYSENQQLISESIWDLFLTASFKSQNLMAILLTKFIQNSCLTKYKYKD